MVTSLDSDQARAFLAEFFAPEGGPKRVRLVAFALSERSATTIRQWFRQEIQLPEHQLNTAIVLATSIQELQKYDGDNTIVSFLLGMNPYLGDKTPLEVLQEGNTKEFTGAVKQFVANG